MHDDDLHLGGICSGIPERRGMQFTTTTLLVVIFAPAHGWITKAQATYGASIENIKEQLQGAEHEGVK